jgi:hypothetical protein
MNLFVFRTIILTSFIFSAALLAEAQSTRTWVSSAGNDANPCTTVAPCKSFAGALAKTFNNGEINCLTPGGYGPVTIAKNITIDCTGTLGGIYAAPATSAVTINIPGGVVRLRGISISGQSAGQYGVTITAAQKVSIEDTVIDGFANGINLVTVAASELSVSNSTIRNNAAGIFINPSSALSATAVTAAVFNSRIMGNTNYGIYAATSDTAVTDCLIAGNSTGILATSGGTVRISGNTVSENNTGISAQTKGAIISYQNNAISGNITANGSPTSTQALQ